MICSKETVLEHQFKALSKIIERVYSREISVKEPADSKESL